MSTYKQRAANRANAQKRTGPVSDPPASRSGTEVDQSHRHVIDPCGQARCTEACLEGLNWQAVIVNDDSPDDADLHRIA
jgi:hypothetical protein